MVHVSVKTKKYKCSIKSVWIVTTWQSISPEVTVKGFKKCCISSAVDGTDDGMLWNGSEEDGMLGMSVRKIETVTLIGKGI